MEQDILRFFEQQRTTFRTTAGELFEWHRFRHAGGRKALAKKLNDMVKRGLLKKTNFKWGNTPKFSLVISQ